MFPKLEHCFGKKLVILSAAKKLAARLKLERSTRLTTQLANVS